MQRNIACAAILAAAVAVFTLAYSFPAAAENWVEAGKSKLGNQDFPYCIDTDDIQKEADGWISYIAAPCDPKWRKLLGEANIRRAVRCDRPISTSEKYKELSKRGWTEERPMSTGVAALAQFACQKR